MQQRVPDPDEIAKLKVGGSDFQDWESVYVQLHFSESFNYFRFTAVEKPGQTQFKVEDECEVELGGEKAISGYITTRQVAYDANSHQVQLQGKSKTFWAAKSSIITARQWDDKSFEDIITDALKPFAANKPKFVDCDKTVFKGTTRVYPGETFWTFCERLARQRRIVCGCDPNGEFKFVGKNDGSTAGTLEEGKNIKRLQWVISIEGAHSEYDFDSSKPATDGDSGVKASKIDTPPKQGKYNKVYSPLKTTNEMPQDLPGSTMRNEHEKEWAEGAVYNAIVTVQGWKSDGGSLWKPGDIVHIKSPMAPLDTNMGIESATFTQDNNSGTLTVLECVPPYKIKDGSEYNFD